jgi:preprotein translocase subunit SecD
MKFAIKIVFALCVLGAAGWGGFWLYRQYAPPGRAGRNMEIRLVAIYATAAPTGASTGAGAAQDTDVASPASSTSGAGIAQANGAAQPAGATADADAFQRQDVSSSIASGNAPSGWKWLPVAKGVEKQVIGNAPAGAQSEYVTRTGNGQLFLLAADTPDMTLTHANNVKQWGVDSVKIVTDEMGPAVEIHLDKNGGDLMHDFTERYLDHRIAVVVAGQICEVALIQSPVRSGLVVRLPIGQQADAENLRDALMK